jgi:hypothetical protein
LLVIPFGPAALKGAAGLATPDSPAFVPPADRIAVFDNDGTLWCEQPVIQLAHILERWEEMARQNPALAKQYGWTVVSMKNDWKTMFA